MKKQFSKKQLMRVVRETVQQEPKPVFEESLQSSGQVTFSLLFSGHDVAMDWSSNHDGDLISLCITERVLQAQYQDNLRKKEAGSSDVLSSKDAARYKDALYLIDKIKQKFIPLVYAKSLEQAKTEQLDEAGAQP